MREIVHVSLNDPSWHSPPYSQLPTPTMETKTFGELEGGEPSTVSSKGAPGWSKSTTTNFCHPAPLCPCTEHQLSLKLLRAPEGQLQLRSDPCWEAGMDNANNQHQPAPSLHCYKPAAPPNPVLAEQSHK